MVHSWKLGILLAFKSHRSGWISECSPFSSVHKITFGKDTRAHPRCYIIHSLDKPETECTIISNLGRKHTTRGCFNSCIAVLFIYFYFFLTCYRYHKHTHFDCQIVCRFPKKKRKQYHRYSFFFKP